MGELINYNQQPFGAMKGMGGCRVKYSTFASKSVVKKVLFVITQIRLIVIFMTAPIYTKKYSILIITKI